MDTKRCMTAVLGLIALSGCVPTRFELKLNFREHSNSPDPVVFAGRDAVRRLDVDYALVDAKGSVRRLDGGEIEIPSGSYKLRVTAKCQPVGEFAFKTTTSFTEASPAEEPSPPVADVITTMGFAIPRPPSEERYLTREVRLREAVFKYGQSPASERVPPNTHVQLIRRWPDERGDCTMGVVVVVDAGGAVKPGRVFLAQLADLSASPGSGLSPTDAWAAIKGTEAEAAKAKAEAAESARAAAVDQVRVVGAREIASGKCDPGREVQLQQAMQTTKTLFDSLGTGRSPEYFIMAATDVIVATPQGTARPYSINASGELHVMALGFAPVELDVLDSRGRGTAMRTPYQALVNQMGSADSRLMLVNAGDRITLKVKGTGCAAFIAFRKL